MSYNIDNFVIYSSKGKIRLPEKYQQLADDGYFPPHYENDFEKWICEKSIGIKIGMYVDGDYGRYAVIYKNGKQLKKEINIDKKGLDYLKDYLKKP